MDVADDLDKARPPLVAAGAPEVVDALAAGAIVALPNVGGYCLAVRAGSPDGEARLIALAADPDGPHYAVGQIEDVHALTSGWTDELGTLLQRCWPGPVEVFVPWAGSDTGPADESTLPTAAAGRRRTAPGRPPSACPTVGRCVVCAGSRAPGGPFRCASPRPRRSSRPSAWTTWLSSSTVAAGKVRRPRWWTPRSRRSASYREGALPTSFIEGTMLMSTRRRLFSRTKRADGADPGPATAGPTVPPVFT